MYHLHKLILLRHGLLSTLHQAALAALKLLREISPHHVKAAAASGAPKIHQRFQSHKQGAHLLQHGAHGLASLGAGHIDGSFALGAALLIQPDVHHLLRRLEHAELGALGKDLRAGDLQLVTPAILES